MTLNVTYNSRNRDNRREFLCRTEKFKNSFVPKTVKQWNTLPNSLKNETNYDTFKDQLYKYTKCNPLFYYGERKYNMIHAQMRLKCSNLNSDLYNMHVLDNPNCVCMFRNEDAQHYFLNCPLYTTERIQLLNVITQFPEINEINTQILLFGSENLTYDQNTVIFNAVHAYIENTKRF